MLLLTTVHFVDRWFGGIAVLGGFLGDEPEHSWARPLGFAVLGFAYVVLGVLAAGRERQREA